MEKGAFSAVPSLFLCVFLLAIVNRYRPCQYRPELTKIFDFGHAELTKAPLLSSRTD
ncbi:hypothetical protein [Atrimonas thermophila]|uniref:hypothetical protein n=1 Tax=Atrimonas thermophila TaxID=3064161 RepID=UPI00399CF8BF